MSKKASQPQQSPLPPGGGVDFLVRTMLEREATGKRPIRPKNVEDLLETMQDESDDPDFDCKDEDSDSDGTDESDEEGSNESEKDDDEEKEDDSDDEDDEDYQEKSAPTDSDTSGNEDSSSDANESSNDSKDSDSDDQEITTKRSALRETLQKLNENDNFAVKRPAKKKRKVTRGADKSTSVKSKSIKSSKSKEPKNPKASKAKRAKQKVTPTKPVIKRKESKVAKAKKVLASKKPKVPSKKKITEKKKKIKGKKTEVQPHHTKRSIRALTDNSASALKENRKEIEGTKPICSACLGDKSDDSNEIVECDSCGISVHESCYGLSPDSASDLSGSGSSSCTEPWFCDVCKNSIENLYCELCPVEGGLFKESTSGRWVHLVCAMYTQGVALHHDSSIDLYEIHYARWGSHSCGACENERKAQTGIVIPCDAGLCKTFFHATCAQKLGLLSDPNHVDFAEADPYYVSCKMHTNQETRRRRVKLFNTLQEQLRIKKERKELDGLPSGANSDHARILRKLGKVRQKTATKRAKYLSSLENVPTNALALTDQVGPSSDMPLHGLPHSWITGNKKQRFMHTSAKLGSGFLLKAERLGVDIVANELEVKHEKIIANVKKKWNVLPAMSVEYAAYYADRENRVASLVEQHQQSSNQNSVLMQNDISLREAYIVQSVNIDMMAEETKAVSQRLDSLVSILTSVCPGDKKLASKLQLLAKPKELAGFRRKSPSVPRDRKSPTPRRSSATSKKSQKNRVLSPSPSRAGKMAIAVCGTCAKSDNQHLITRCDKCKKHYHLRCLDPPLTRMPKRSRLCGWMCSDCCDSPSDPEGQVDTEAPRTLRGRTKIHKPRKYRGSDDSEEDVKTPPVGRKAKSNSSMISPSLSASEVNPVMDSLLSPGYFAVQPTQSSTPFDNRGRNDTTNLVRQGTSSWSNMSPPNANSITMNGPTKSEFPVPLAISTTATGYSDINTTSEESHVLITKPTKKKKSTVPKAPKTKPGKVINSINIDGVMFHEEVTASPVAKRKSSDGPLITKENGRKELLLTNSDGSKLPKPKKSRGTKKSESGISKSEIDVNISTTTVHAEDSQSQQMVIPKLKKSGTKKKKSDLATPTNEVVTEKPVEGGVATLKIKRPRSKKKKNDIIPINCDEFGLQSSVSELDNSIAVPKPKKPRAKKTKPDLDDIPKVDDGLTKNGLILPVGVSNISVGSGMNPSEKVKKPRKKKEPAANPNVNVTCVSTTFEGESGDTPVKTKKPRKKKEVVTNIPNSFSDASVVEGEGSSIPVKAKKPRKRKQLANSTDNVGASPADGETGSSTTKVKKPRKKKGVASAADPSSDSKITAVEGESSINNAATVKVKKPRKKAGKPGDETNEQGSAKTEKATKKKLTKAKASLNQSSAARDAKVEVNLVMEKVTSQVFVDKLKGVKNGNVKPRKRKNPMNASGSDPTSSTTPTSSSTTDEKEKCVPPKKRKRAPSTAQQQGQLNNIDNVITSVVRGNSSEGPRRLENGDIASAEVSTIMQGINRQLAPEQNIMQGKAMGSGVSSEEMVTVDASFLIDGVSSGSTNFMNSSVPTFYASTDHQAGVAGRDEGAILKLAGLGTDRSSGNEENVIRLQYIDQGMTDSTAVPDTEAMPPPAVARPSASPNTFLAPHGVCATCTKTDNKMKLVMCDKCQLEYHFMCVNPPTKYSPRRKGHPWFCRDCDDNEAHENGLVHHIQ